MATKPTGRTTRKVAATVKRQRSIQHQAKAKKSASPAAGRKKQVQAGSRRQPRNPMPAQHLAKPGNEADLDLQPRFLAPDYIGSGKPQKRLREMHQSPMFESQSSMRLPA